MTVESTALLYQSPDASINSLPVQSVVLILYRFVLGDVLEAFQAYLARDFTAFDAHVGDTLCQVRAYQLLRLVNERKVSVATVQKKIKELSSIYNKLESTLSANTPLYLSSAKLSLKTFLKSIALDFNLDKNLIYLAQAFILSKYKKSDDSGDLLIDMHALMVQGELSKKSARKLVRHHQINLSQSSCEFVASLVDDLPNVDVNKGLFQRLQKCDDAGRSVLPTYFVTQILLDHVVQSGGTLLLVMHRQQVQIVDSVYLLLSAADDGLGFKVVPDPSRSLIDNASYIFEGVVCYNKDEVVESALTYANRLMSYDVKDLIMQAMAAHPQFSGKALAALNDNPYALDLFDNLSSEEVVCLNQLSADFQRDREAADISGCSINNQSLFFPRHVFCDVVRTQLALASRGRYINSMLSPQFATNDQPILLECFKDLTYNTH